MAVMRLHSKHLVSIGIQLLQIVAWVKLIAVNCELMVQALKITINLKLERIRGRSKALQYAFPTLIKRFYVRFIY